MLLKLHRKIHQRRLGKGVRQIYSVKPEKKMANGLSREIVPDYYCPEQRSAPGLSSVAKYFALDQIEAIQIYPPEHE